MAIDYEKYINSKSTHYISNSGGDSKGGISGDAAGDQTGKEWQLKAWYSRPWTHVLRHPDPQVRRCIAELAIEGALNDKIGYDQNQRGTFWTQLKASDYRPANIAVACEEDCSAGVNSIVKAAGCLLNIEALKNVSSANTSRNTLAALKAAGFEALTASKYLTGPKYLLPGDILLYENHHVATNITRGAKAEADPKLGDRELKSGMSGGDVAELQKKLISLGYDCGPDGADGDFGPNTEAAVYNFQYHSGLPNTGIADQATIAALISGNAVSNDNQITIVNCKSCNLRLGPGTNFPIRTTAAPGCKFTKVDTTGWTLALTPEGELLWVSDKYVQIGGGKT